MKLIVFGATGFLGKSFMDYVMMNNLPDTPEITPMGSLDCDLTNYEDVKSVIEGHDAVLNLAGVVGGIKFNTHNQLYIYEKNHAICTNVIKAAAEMGLTKCCTALSTCIFPDFEEEDYPINEHHFYGGLGLPKSNYGYAAAKRAAHELTTLYRLSDPDKYRGYTTFTPTNLFGVNDNYNPETSHFVASVIRKVCEAQEGSTLNFHGTPKVKRQQLSAEAASGMIYNVLMSYDGGLPIILTTDNSLTNEEVIKEIIDISGKDLSYQFDGLYPGQLIKDCSGKYFKSIFGYTVKTTRDDFEKVYNYYVNSLQKN